MAKKVIVMGGDGFCGWPTSLHLSKAGYDVIIVDNLSRRNIDNELCIDSLTPIRDIDTRLARWEELTGNTIEFHNLDIDKEYDRVADLIEQKQPEAIVHFAEQRAAPYSMKSEKHKRYTVDNNLNATHNILCAVTEKSKDTHVIHLGSMGVYGYSSVGLPIPEGYLDVSVEAPTGEKQLTIMYPPNPGSIYHMTKTQDALFFHYYNKNDGLKITDLHQGIVWGTNTDETRMHEDLINRFDYDGDYGTVLNRFLMQAAVGHPLTVHGTGGQTRAFIHISDTVRCIKSAIENPPGEEEKVNVYNQASETLRIIDLANKVSELTGAEIRYYKNPRNEAVENDLEVINENFSKLGLDLVKLDEGLMMEVNEIADRYASRCKKDKIVCTSTWNKEIEVDMVGEKKKG